MGDFEDIGRAFTKFFVVVLVVVMLVIGGCGFVIGRSLGGDAIDRIQSAEDRRWEEDRDAERQSQEQWARNAPLRMADALGRLAKQAEGLRPEVAGLREDIRAIRDELRLLREAVTQPGGDVERACEKSCGE